MDKRTIFFIILVAVSFYFIQLFFPSNKIDPVQEEIKEKSVVVSEKQQSPKLQKAIKTKNGKETFYVLENDFQQIVFSSIGGSISEINLPFKSKKNDKSIINEIKFDREIIDFSPQNAKFPLNSYKIIENGKIIDKTNTLGGYYPLIRRQLIGSDEKISPNFYALNIISDTDNIGNANYDLVKFEKDSIEFELTFPNGKITKTYTVAKDAPYVFDLEISILGDLKNLWLTSAVPEVELTSGRSEPTIKLKTSRKQKSEIEKISLPKSQTTVSSFYLDWMCTSNGFLGIILDPLTEVSPGYRAKYVSGELLPTRLTLIDPRYNLYPKNKFPGYELFLPLKTSNTKTTFRVFAGPFAKHTLKAIDETYSNAITGYNPDYIGAQSAHGFLSSITGPFVKLMFSIMELFHKLTNSWGLSIILLTLVLRIMLYPLNAWSIKSQMKMQDLSPKIQAIQKKYEKNPQKAKMEIMKMYREKGGNPLMGCFPMLIQLPFLIGMFNLLKSSFELRGVSFIPGWIDNLTAPDIVFSWNMPIPVIGQEFHLLPIIMGLVMFLQTKFSTPKKAPTEMTDQQRQQQAMTTIMPIVFTFIFYKMPSGLNIYYLFFSLFGIVQQWIMNKTKNKKLKI